MNNKTLSIIATLILVLAVGFIAYSAGKSNSTNQTPVTPNTQTQTNQNPNGPDYFPNGNPATKDAQQADGGSGCDTNSPPSITVLSPNGGEAYTAGQTITVTWESCNIPSTDNVAVGLIYKSGTGFTMVNNGDSRSNGLNDGTETFTIPSTETKGLAYKADVDSWKTGGVSDIDDVSDNVFTIN